MGSLVEAPPGAVSGRMFGRYQAITNAFPLAFGRTTRVRGTPGTILEMRARFQSRSSDRVLSVMAFHEKAITRFERQSAI